VNALPPAETASTVLIVDDSPINVAVMMELGGGGLVAVQTKLREAITQTTAAAPLPGAFASARTPRKLESQ